MTPIQFHQTRQRLASDRLRVGNTAAMRLRFVEREMTLHRRSTEDLAAILGVPESEVWNMRQKMDPSRARKVRVLA
jgi:hypothetical protein